MKAQLSRNHQNYPKKLDIGLINQQIATSFSSNFEDLNHWKIDSNGATSGNFHKEERHVIRIALYSHDTMGLGHSRRNQLLAQTLANAGWHTSILMIAGIQQPNALLTVPGIDYLTLPSLHKEANGEYRSRHLHLSLKKLINLRSQTIRSALKAFQPDVFIVDNVPRGACRELDPVLKYLQKQKHISCILGLRDVLDDPDTVQREWERAKNEDAIRKYYDAVWVYGDPTIYNPVHEYHFSADVAAKMHCIGYLDQKMRLNFLKDRVQGSLKDKESNPLADLNLPPGQLVLCLVGGGQDGANLAEAFCQAVLPPETNGVIVTGPFMSPETRLRLHYHADRNPRLRILNYVSEPTLLLNYADRVIAMGGYNTTCEILSFEKRALIVPRVRPRYEQLIRAERLRDLGLIDLLHPDQLSAKAITEWLALERTAPQVRERVDLNGLSRLPCLLEEMTLSSLNTKKCREK